MVQVQAPAFTLGDEVIDWIETHCVFPSGKWIGSPFVLLPWQRAFVRDLYACDEDGNLVYKWALLGIPKKNGKSTLAAALGLHHTLGDPDEVDPWTVCGASSREQADLVFNAAKRMCEISPTLKRNTRLYASVIEPRYGYGKMEKIASARGHLDGKNISLALLDELHEWDREDYEIVTNGTVARERSQIIQITTAGYDLQTVCGEEYLKGRAIERGEVENPTYLFRWYGAGEDEDWRDPAVWERANPSYNVTVTHDAIDDKFHNTRESQFRRYFLNQWVAAESIWIPEHVWNEGIDHDAAALVPGKPTYGGWDASTRRDTTAVCLAQWVDDENPPGDETPESSTALPAQQEPAPDGADAVDIAAQIAEALAAFLRRNRRRLRVEVRIWSRPLRPDGKPDEDWTLPIEEVEAYVRTACTLYDVREIDYDPMFITWSATTLEAQGIPMVEFPQTDSRMCPATQATYELVMRRLLVHNGDKQFSRHVQSTAIANARNGGQRVAKGKARNPMDASVAMVMAVYRAVRALLEAEERGPELWI